MGFRGHLPVRPARSRGCPQGGSGSLVAEPPKSQAKEVLREGLLPVHDLVFDRAHHGTGSEVSPDRVSPLSPEYVPAPRFIDDLTLLLNTQLGWNPCSRLRGARRG